MVYTILVVVVVVEVRGRGLERVTRDGDDDGQVLCL
jgi:hypothetical protein